MVWFERGLTYTNEQIMVIW